MKKRILIAAVITLAATCALADGYVPETRATSVAEMLQTKQLREQLTREGRLDELRKLDDEKRQKLREQQELLYSKLSDQIAMCEVPANSAASKKTNEQARNTANPVAPLLTWLSSLLPDSGTASGQASR